jgi:hypothetical protein
LSSILHNSAVRNVAIPFFLQFLNPNLNIQEFSSFVAVDKLKFEYKREIIDEEGDGEFVSKPKNEKTLKRSRRSLESEDFDGRKKMALRAMPDTSDATNPKMAVAEPSRRGTIIKKF